MNNSTERAAFEALCAENGWMLVPAEPTPEQLLKVYKQTGVSRKELADLWTAMLNAAPQPPEAEGLKSEIRTTKDPEFWRDVAELCAQMCDSRARSLLGDKQLTAATEAKKCASVLRDPPEYWREKLNAAAPQPPEGAL